MALYTPWRTSDRQEVKKGSTSDLTEKGPRAGSRGYFFFQASSAPFVAMPRGWNMLCFLRGLQRLRWPHFLMPPVCAGCRVRGRAFREESNRGLPLRDL